MRTIFEVHPEIKEINFAGTDVVNILNQVLSGHLIGNIFDHDRAPRVKTFFDTSYIQKVSIVNAGSRSSQS